MFDTPASLYASSRHSYQYVKRSRFEKVQRLLGVKEDIEELSTDPSRFSLEILGDCCDVHDLEPSDRGIEAYDVCFVFRLPKDFDTMMSPSAVRECFMRSFCCSNRSNYDESISMGIRPNPLHRASIDVACKDRCDGAGHYGEVSGDEDINIGSEEFALPDELLDGIEQDLLKENNPQPKSEVSRKTFEVFVKFLLKGGCQILPCVSSDLEFIFLKCRLGEKACRHIAAREGYKLQLDHRATTIERLFDDPEFVAPYHRYTPEAEEGFKFSCMTYLGRVWKRYDHSSREILHPVDDLADASIFRNVDRIRLLNVILDDVFDLQFMKKHELMDAHFFIHDRRQRRHLRRTWALFSFCFSADQPIEEIRNYYGENIAFYFLWVSYYARQLITPSILGLMTFIYQLYYDANMTFDLKRVCLVSSLYSLYMVSWAAGVSADWEDIESLYVLRWGMKQEMRPQPRPEFKGDYMQPDVVTPTYLIPTYGGIKATCRKIATWGASALFVAGVTLSVAGTLTAQTFFAKFARNMPQYAAFKMRIGVNMFLATQILLLDILWTRLAYVLARFENHKYDKDYTNSVITKMASLRFFNYFYSLLYTAYIKGFVDPCEGEINCGITLKIQLVFVFCIALMTNLIEIGQPAMEYFRRKRLRMTRGKLTWIEVQHNMPSYNSSEEVVEDFMEIIITFGFVAVFSVVLPIIPILALMCALFELRSDAFKITVIHRRPFPSPSKGLGAWKSVIKFVGFFAVANNAALTIFRFKAFGDNLSTKQQIILFIVLEHLCIAMYMLWREWRRNVSTRAKVLKERMRIVLNKSVWGGSALSTFASGVMNEEEAYRDVEEKSQMHLLRRN